VFGDTQEQLCIPSEYKLRCLDMAHHNFGHQGRNKILQLLRPYFYWPNMTRDCLLHVRACEVCQKADKTLQKPNHMTRPFEDIAVDIVGPFPIAVEGFRFLLTCIHNATRWPEARPLRFTTAKTCSQELAFLHDSLRTTQASSQEKLSLSG